MKKIIEIKIESGVLYKYLLEYFKNICTEYDKKYRLKFLSTGG